MPKTGKQIQGDIYSLLRASALSSMITGDVYRKGMRPRDSKLEDAVVIFTGGFANEIQSGVVTVNIYVPDIDPREDGVLTEDGARTEELERAADDWVKTLTASRGCYHFRLGQTITTEYEPEIQQHFVVVKLYYRFFGSDDATVDTSNVISNP